VPTTGSFFDNFIGPAGSPPNPQIWGYDLGGGGWGNNEQEVYTNSPNNVRLDGNGDLVIQAQRTPTGYTSARLVTRGKADIQYGTLMARIKFPSGQGIWPAFWMLGSNIDSVGWPAAGEIDMMELPDVGTTYNTALHGPWANGQPGFWTASTSGPAGTDLSTGFHNYWVTREPGLIMVGVDGYVRSVYTRSSIPAGAQWVFDAPSYALLNVAVGGNWPGPPSNSTPFPATMLVDWVSYAATPVAGTTSVVKTASTLSAAAPAQRGGPSGATAIASAVASPTVVGAPVAAAGRRPTATVSTTLPSSAHSGDAPTAKPTAPSGGAHGADRVAVSAGGSSGAVVASSSISGIGPSGAAGNSGAGVPPANSRAGVPPANSSAGVPPASGSAAAATGTGKPGPGGHVPAG
jgi:beta-glucanase (GH16 family)